MHIAEQDNVPVEVKKRPAVQGDEDFLRLVYASTRADEMKLVDWTAEQKAAFIDMQFRAQHVYYHEQFPTAAYDILVSHGKDIGRLYVERRETEIRVLDIALLPEDRNRGIGTSLMRKIMDEAASTGRSVTLHVETFNRARALYDRLGFNHLRDDGIYILMEWKANYDRH